MTALLGRLPGWVRVPLVALVVAAGVWWTMRSMLKVDPWSWEVAVGAALGALAAWRFRWRARTKPTRWLLLAGVGVFAVGMIVAHVRGIDHNNTIFFLFSGLLVSLPYNRALGREEVADAARAQGKLAHGEADEREAAERQGPTPGQLPPD